MSASKTLFAVTFMIFASITLAVPSFPPAQLLYHYTRTIQTTLSIGGISAANLLNGVANGFFWAFVAVAMYVVVSHASEFKPLPPMPIAPHLLTPPLESPLVDSMENRIPPALTIPATPISIIEVEPSETSVATELIPVMAEKEPGIKLDIEAIEGIGPVNGALLRNLGISTVNHLLRVCPTESERRRLASEVGVSYSTLLRWVFRGDLLRIKGIGTKYATLLESAGVSTVTDLSTQNPYHLCQTLKAVNQERVPVKRIPPSKTIEIWVRNAKSLEPMLVE